MVANAIDEIARFLNCEAKLVERRLRNAYVNSLVSEHLRDEFDMFVDHSGKRQWIKFHGLSFKDVNHLWAYNGKHNITVAQHFYSRHSVELNFPHLQCVMEPRGKTDFSFYPIEVIKLVRKNYREITV